MSRSSATEIRERSSLETVAPASNARYPPSEHPCAQHSSFDLKLPTPTSNSQLLRRPIFKSRMGHSEPQKMRCGGISCDKRLRLRVALVTLTKLRGPTARGRLVPLEVVRHSSPIGHEPTNSVFACKARNARSGESRRSLWRRRISSPPPRMIDAGRVSVRRGVQ